MQEIQHVRRLPEKKPQAVATERPVRPELSAVGLPSIDGATSVLNYVIRD